MSDLVVAVGLVFVIEGLLYAAFPGGMRRMVEEMTSVPDQGLRKAGLAAACIGLFIVWMMRG